MNEVMPSTLYVVGTPIGNTEEISFRAVKTLRGVDYILCEDTRHSLGLLNALEISKPLRAHHKFNERATVDAIVSDLKQGKSVALITDAGMPCVSDPGNLLVSACREQGVSVTVVSGPCAAIDALVLSGMDSTRFCFVGFLPDKNKERAQLLSKFCEVEATLIFYVPPHSLNEDLVTLYRGLGARKAVLVREITKIHEETIETVLCETPDFAARGEYVVIVEGAPKRQDPLLALSPQEHLNRLIEEGADRKSAIKTVASARGLTRNDVYQLTVKKE